MLVDTNFWKNKKVFLTGHTGFKGGWMSLWLTKMGAKVCGFALEAEDQRGLFNSTHLDKLISKSIIGDINRMGELEEAMKAFEPEVVFHLAAQPLVRDSYTNPVATFQTNVMGTVNVLETCRNTRSVKTITVITSDKCYENREQIFPYREIDAYGGSDPYSASKGACEIVVASYAKSYFSQENTASLSTVRAGNVIGGGDWSKDRLIPDLIRAQQKNETASIRYPQAVRPWQHVLEPLSGYLKLAQMQWDNAKAFSGGWNFGPGIQGEKNVRTLIETFNELEGIKVKVEYGTEATLHEAQLLRLDISKSASLLNWRPRLSFMQSLEMTKRWYEIQINQSEMAKFSLEQIDLFENL